MRGLVVQQGGLKACTTVAIDDSNEVRGARPLHLVYFREGNLMNTSMFVRSSCIARYVGTVGICTKKGGVLNNVASFTDKE